MVGLAVLGLSAQKPTFIFRYIAITQKDSIVLGRPFRAFAWADTVDRTTYQLKNHAFGGTERIRIHTDTLGAVVAMEFLYPDGRHFQDMLRDYIRSLGQPTKTDSTDHSRLAVWQDAETRFELRSAQVGEHEFVTSRMTDVTKR